MSIPLSGGAADAGRGLHVPAGGGITTWFNGDIVTTKLTAQQSSGALGFIEVTCPPGGGPVPHVHPGTDETFYMISGELEFLQGDKIFTAGAGDLVFIPRGLTHRFHNPGIQPARMVFVYTPAAPRACSSRSVMSRGRARRSSPGALSASLTTCSACYPYTIMRCPADLCLSEAHGR